MAQQIPVPIGEMRWLVTLAKRNESPTFDQTNITEAIVPIAEVHCSIEPVGTMTFFGTEQLDTPITHTAYMRWRPFQDLQMFNVILRKIILPDGSVRSETYRIRRAQEWMGRHRFIRLDIELELYKS